MRGPVGWALTGDCTQSPKSYWGQVPSVPSGGDAHALTHINLRYGNYSPSRLWELDVSIAARKKDFISFSTLPLFGSDLVIMMSSKALHLIPK